MGDNVAAPVISGLAVGVAFIILLSFSFNTVDSELMKGRHLDVSVEGLKDRYAIGDTIDFVVKARGVDILCGYPSAKIVDADTGKERYLINLFSIILCDPGVRNVNEVWTLEEMGAANPITMDKIGNYKIFVHYDGRIIEKEFDVISANSGNSVSSEQVPDGQVIEVDVHNAIDDPEWITFDSEPHFGVRDSSEIDEEQ